MGKEWLLAAQQADGSFRTQDQRPVTAHAVTVLLLASLEQLSPDEELRQPLEKAASHLLGLQNKKTGAWAESADGPDNVVATAWATVALQSAASSIEADQEVLYGTVEWLESLYDRERGELALRPGQPSSPLATTTGLAAHELALGIEYNDETIFSHGGIRALARRAPQHDGAQDIEQWFFGALFLQRQLKHLPEQYASYYPPLRKVLIESQLREGCSDGAWTPDRPPRSSGAPERNRVETTVLATHCLELYYKYLNVGDPVEAWE